MVLRNWHEIDHADSHNGPQLFPKLEYGSHSGERFRAHHKNHVFGCAWTPVHAYGQTPNQSMGNPEANQSV